MKNIFNLFMAAIAVILMSSCGGGGGEDEPKPAKLVLKADKTSVDAGATVTFTVTQNGVDVTDKTTICTLDGGICLASNKFVTTDDGTFTFSAKFKEGSDKQDNQVKVTVKATTLKLLASAGSVEMGKSVTFQVTLSGTNVTDQSTIALVGGSNLASSTWSSAAAGDYTFKATHGTFTSNEVQVTVKQPEPEYSTTWSGSKTLWKNVMHFTVTADWCAPCYSLKNYIKEIGANNIISVYAYTESRTSFINSENETAINDVWKDVRDNSGGRFSVTSYPTTFWEFDKSFQGATPVATLKPEYDKWNSNAARTGIKVEPTVSGTTLNLKITVGAKEADTYRLAAVLVEDNVKSSQNTTPTVVDNDYIHNGVLRQKITFGEDLGAMTAGQTVTKTYNDIALKYTVANMSVVVFTLYKKDDDKFYVANSVKAPLNKTTGYAYVK